MLTYGKEATDWHSRDQNVESGVHMGYWMDLICSVLKVFVINLNEKNAMPCMESFPATRSMPCMEMSGIARPWQSISQYSWFEYLSRS